ncbi:MAG: hypothetical protein H0X52_05930 [Gemmatimonadetes bacterium]|nr:hypothetical protein [Gemmatimonadota bacterium]
MHLLLTDVLACPRCGPEFGLILLADEVRERRVLQGHLGCPNCREEYPIRHGVADLRFPPPAETGSPEKPVEASEELALRVAALLGVRTPGARILLIGAGANLALGLSRLLPDVEVIALVGRPDAAEQDLAGVSVVAAGAVLPFQLGKLHAAAILGGADQADVSRAAAVLARGARLLIDPAEEGVRDGLEAAGLQLLLDESGAVLAVRAGVAHPQAHP